MNADLWSQFGLAAIVASGMAAVLAVTIVYFRANRRAHYDLERHRAELEMVRSSLERRIYELTDRLVSTEGRWRDVNHLLVSRLETQPAKANLPPPPLSRFLRSYGISAEDMEVDPQLVFVLTPFHEEFQDIFSSVAMACQRVNLNCLRGDEQQVTGDLMPHILRLILKARVIVAVIDGRNPNVFYELGLAHALDKVTILISSDVKSAPFDLRSKKLIVADSPVELQTKLTEELTRTVLQTSQPSQPLLP